MKEGIIHHLKDEELIKKSRDLVGYRGQKLLPSVRKSIQTKLVEFLNANSMRFPNLYLPKTQ